MAYIADGIDPANPDLIRADGSRVITDYQAFSADGPAPEEGGAEAYGDASSIGAQGRVAHDLSDYVNPAYPLPKGCNIRILGMAPGRQHRGAQDRLLHHLDHPGHRLRHHAPPRST